MRRHLVASAVAVLTAASAGAADLDGVAMPDRAEAGGRPLVLNGMATRTYSLLRIKVYVAGLYLERPSRDAAAILASPEAKLVAVRYLQPVGREDAVAAWEHFLRANCTAPCRLPEEATARFIGMLGPVARGDTMRLTFVGDTVEVEVSGRPRGTVADAAFARLLLATWIGDVPTSEGVRRGLLAGRPPP